MLVGGRYEIIRELGRGGFGKTYLAEDTYRRGRPKCVVKKIQPLSKLPALLQKARAMFEAEAQTLYELGTHDQIPRLFAHFEQHGEFYTIQELIDGHDLRQSFVVGDRWDEKKLIALLREILEILAFVHDRQAVHQDINPQNLIRRWQDKKLELIDFGGIKSIRYLQIDAQGNVSLAQAIGTPGYIAPEQIAGQPLPASDLYTVGMIGIQALTGYLPNQLPRSDAQAVEWHDQAQVSPQLAALLDQMVCVDLSQRYSSAADALADLTAFSPAKPTMSLSGLWEKTVRTREVIVSASFDAALNFSEGLAAVVTEQKLGYIDRTGKFAIVPQFDCNPVRLFRQRAYQFAEGLASVAIDSHWGYINPTGKFVIAPQFDGAACFAAGLARIEVNHQYGFIDRTGKFVIAPQFESAAAAFAEKLAGVEIDHLYGYIDLSGRVVINPQFDSADDFSEGLARVTIDSQSGFIDKTGRLVIPAQFDVAHTFCEGLARVRIDGRYGYIDRTGAVRIPPQFEDTYSFTEGLALVRSQNQSGFIDKVGNLLIPLQFEDAYPFSEGVAAVKVGNLWGFIDKTGEFVVNLQFEDASSFCGGRAAVKRDGKWGYLG
jgi:hypothetical protein